MVDVCSIGDDLHNSASPPSSSGPSRGPQPSKKRKLVRRTTVMVFLKPPLDSRQTWRRPVFFGVALLEKSGGPKAEAPNRPGKERCVANVVAPKLN